MATQKRGYWTLFGVSAVAGNRLASARGSLASLIFHVRPRLARSGAPAHEAGCWHFSHHRRNSEAPDWPAHCTGDSQSTRCRRRRTVGRRVMDACRGIFGFCTRRLGFSNSERKPVSDDPVSQHWRGIGPRRTGSLVLGRLALWMEKNRYRTLATERLPRIFIAYFRNPEKFNSRLSLTCRTLEEPCCGPDFLPCSTGQGHVCAFP
jgi:hypothetical protein